MDKITATPAKVMNLPHRGRLAPGYYADLTVFSEDELRNAVPDQKKSFGIRKVWINGKAVFDGEAIDREAINQKFYNGHAKVATLPAEPGTPYYSTTLADKYKYDSLRFIQVLSRTKRTSAASGVQR